MYKYEERVKQRAEEMAALYVNAELSTYEIIPIGVPSSFDEWTRSQQKVMIKRFIETARLSVQREAEAYKNGYMSNCPENSEEEEKMWQSNCNWEMQEIGLIPPQTQTT